MDCDCNEEFVTCGLRRAAVGSRDECGRLSGGDARESVQGAINRPLRILFHINDFGKGGTETSLLAWLNALSGAHFAPAVSVAYPTDDLEFWRMASLPSNVPVHTLASAEWMCRTHDTARRKKLKGATKLYHKLITYAVVRPLAARRLKQIAKGFDVVVDYDLSLRYMAGSWGLPVIGVSHFSLATRIGNRGTRYIARRLKQYRQYSALAVLTYDMAREARALFGSEALNVVELPNVIDIDKIRGEASAAVECPVNRYIISVARLDEGQKDHATLLRAFAKLPPSTGVVDLVLIGDGPDRAKLEQLATELGIHERVQFMGFLANPFPYIRHARMLVLSSQYEGFGMVLGEAMALGTPVISSDCPTGPADLLNGGKAGLLVPPGDVDAMALAICNLLDDSPLRREQIANASKRIEAFAPERASTRMMKLIRQVLGDARR